MSDFVSFSDLKGRVSIEQVISVLNLKIHKREANGQWRAPCPNCKGANQRALSINVRENVFRCFTDPKGKGDQIALAAHCRGTSQRDAAVWLSEHFRDHSPTPGPRKEEPDRPSVEARVVDLEERIAELEARVAELEEQASNVVPIRKPA